MAKPHEPTPPMAPEPTRGSVPESKHPSPPPAKDQRVEAYKVAMVHFAIEKGIWQEELATDEAFRNRLEAIVKSEKAKAESGHYRDPGNRDR